MPEPNSMGLFADTAFQRLPASSAPALPPVLPLAFLRRLLAPTDILNI